MVQINKALIMCICILIGGFCYAEICKDPQEIIHYKNPLLDRKCYWFMRVEEFKNSKEKASVVMIGDSITQNGNWQELLQTNDLANRGIGGDTTALILERMDSIESVCPSVAYIMVGVNDFYRDAKVETIFRNYRFLIYYLWSKNIKVNVISTLHCNSNLDKTKCKEVNKKIKALNDELQKIKGLTFINANAKLSKNNELIAKYSTDGIHLNKDGYEVLATEIKKSMQ